MYKLGNNSSNVENVFKYGRDIALISHNQELITDEELGFLLEENTSRNSEFSYDVYDCLDLEKIEEPEEFIRSSQHRRTSCTSVRSICELVL